MNKALTELHITGKKKKDKVLLWFKTFHYKSLGNKIGDIGATHFGDALKTNKALMKLNLKSSNNLPHSIVLLYGEKLIFKLFNR